MNVIPSTIMNIIFFFLCQTLLPIYILFSRIYNLIRFQSQRRKCNADQTKFHWKSKKSTILMPTLRKTAKKCYVSSHTMCKLYFVHIFMDIKHTSKITFHTYQFKYKFHFLVCNTTVQKQKK